MSRKMQASATGGQADAASTNRLIPVVDGLFLPHPAG
jgi:hypothetical protein